MLSCVEVALLKLSSDSFEEVSIFGEQKVLHPLPSEQVLLLLLLLLEQLSIAHDLLAVLFCHLPVALKHPFDLALDEPVIVCLELHAFLTVRLEL